MCFFLLTSWATQNLELKFEEHCLLGCKPINLRTPEDGDSTFYETSVQNSATWYKVPEDIFNESYQIVACNHGKVIMVKLQDTIMTLICPVVEYGASNLPVC
jgi:hypothetical protein